MWSVLKGALTHWRVGLTLRFRSTGDTEKKTSTYKYFTDDELKGLDPKLCNMLDQARGVSGVPYRLTATLATAGHAANSAHYKGLAVDIGLGHLDEGATRDRVRHAILFGLFLANFQRIEICEKHIHADIGGPPDYVTPLSWIGVDK